MSSLRPGLAEIVKGKVTGKAERWREYVETSATVLAHFQNKHAALTAKANHHYLGCWPDKNLLHTTIVLLTKKAKLKTTMLPAHIRIRQRGHLSFAFNYGNKSWAVPTKVKLLLGDRVLRPQAVAVWKNFV